MHAVLPCDVSTLAHDLSFFAQPLLCPEPGFHRPELKDGRLHLQPSTAIEPSPSGELQIVVGDAALGGAPRHHHQEEIRAGFLRAQMPGVGKEGVGEEREAGELTHDGGAFDRPSEGRCSAQ
jgi:hypothetical protein